jgi:Mannosyltransferase putative
MCSVWPALLSALFFNIHLQLFAPLFTGYMGMGDKETFPMAFLAHGLPYSVVPTGPSALGKPVQRDCVLGFGCAPRVELNTMVQVTPAGSIAFLHANMQKWYLAVETDYKEHPLRWQALMPGPDSLVQAFRPLSVRLFGYAASQPGCRSHARMGTLHIVSFPTPAGVDFVLVLNLRVSVCK